MIFYSLLAIMPQSMPRVEFNVKTAPAKDLIRLGVVTKRHEELTSFDKILVEEDLIDTPSHKCLKKVHAGTTRSN